MLAIVYIYNRWTKSEIKVFFFIKKFFECQLGQLLSNSAEKLLIQSQTVICKYKYK